MQEEIFGPIVTVYVYPDQDFIQTLRLVSSSSFALTGAIFATDQSAISEASKILRQSAGNYYVNDKCTGSVVGQQPFGGARLSGTNDKPGGPHYPLKFTSPIAIKTTHAPLTQWTYPHML
uniref:Delta-1-pyrroline-5-carboxylate dehydrogenase, mitochondrial-like n=1 Tax=Saccoglossus kowalevskii TaxID=10224 RepID=A0ABM0MPT7_SACKO|nr:PREDICTED: delta-1-pyrroline-5-carboxylate dehydrogenase, mitochondrial-like [Saccoglossus kowalevskii]